jgi:DeoR/GlpR family transcriptional regulator of sugar metabolism
VTRTAGALLPGERRRLIEERLRQRGSVSVAALEAEFAISPMTVRRDLVEFERQGIAQRTHGGAILPGLSSHEDSFFKRLEVAVEAKERLADAAVALLAPGNAVFVDSSTTAYFVARRLVRENFRCTLLTNAVPGIEMARCLPEDVAHAVLHFASDARSGKSTGNILNVDGGVPAAYPR